MLTKIQAARTVDGPFLNAVSTQGYFYVGFTDLYEAQATMDFARHSCPYWKIENVTRETFDTSTQLVTTPPRGFEDFVQVFIYAGPNAGLSPSSLAPTVKLALEMVGPVHHAEVVVFDETPGARLTVHEVRVRFADCRYAMNAAKCMNGFRYEVSFTFTLHIICFRFRKLTIFQHVVFEVLPWSPSAEVRGHWAWSKPARRPVPSTPGGTEKKAGDASSPEKDKVIKDDLIVRGLDPRTTVCPTF